MLDLIEKVPNAHLIYAVHKNPVVLEIAKEILGSHPRVKLIDPPDYFDFIQIMKRARLILTDSGGIQEEAPSLGVPVLVLRDTTERPEAIGAGVAKLIGPIREKILEEGLPLLIDDAEHAKMARAANPYGDGKACARIVGILKYFFEMSKEIPDDFKV
jgi:UDP-N-acetylglucosamine 2-epimerase (non-hydrolysing)